MQENGCWFDAPDASAHVEAAFRSGEISDVEAQRLWSYIRNGYYTAGGLIPKESVDRLRNDLDNFWFADTPVPGLNVEGLMLNSGAPQFSLTHEEILSRPVEERSRLRDSGRWRIHALHKVFSSCAALCNCEGIFAAVRSILKIDNIHVNSTNAFVFPTQQSAHEDFPYLRCDPSYQVVGLWVALEDVAAHQGPFFVCPGTHKEPKHPAFADHPKSSYWDVSNEVRGDWLMRSEQRSQKYPRFEFRAPAGECLFYHPNLTHGGATVTHSGSTRKSIAIFYTEAETA